jgi:hypothetical protein
MFNYNGFSYWFIYNFDLQHKPKTAIILNSILPLVGIMNIMKINVKFIKKMYGYKVWSIIQNITTHLGFYNRLIKWPLSFFTTIVHSCSWLHSCKGHCSATWHYDFLIVVNIMTCEFYTNITFSKMYFYVFLVIQN